MCTLTITSVVLCCVNGRSYVCCGECYVVSDECDEPTAWVDNSPPPALCNLFVAHCCESYVYFGCFDFGGELDFPEL